MIVIRSGFRQKPIRGVQIDWGHPLARGLGAAWLLNDPEATTAWRDVANGNTATLTGTSYSSNPASGSAIDWGDGYQYGVSTGVGIWLDAAHSPSLTFSDALSVLAIVYFGSGVNGIMVSKDSNTLGRSFDLETYSGNTRWYINGGAGANLLSVANATPVRFHQYVGTWGGTTGKLLRLYYDGRLVGEQASADATLGTCTEKIGIGRRFYAGFEGYLGATFAQVCLWSRELTAGDVFWLSREPFAFVQSPRANPRVFVASTAGGYSGRIIRGVGRGILR